MWIQQHFQQLIKFLYVKFDWISRIFSICKQRVKVSLLKHMQTNKLTINEFTLIISCFYVCSIIFITTNNNDVFAIGFDLQWKNDIMVNFIVIYDNYSNDRFGQNTIWLFLNGLIVLMEKKVCNKNKSNARCTELHWNKCK